MSPSRAATSILLAVLSLSACTVDEVDADGGEAASPQNGPVDPEPSACLYVQSKSIHCPSIPGGPTSEETAECQEQRCPKKSESSTSSMCWSSTSRSNFRTYPGTCADVLAREKAGELPAPTCGVRLELASYQCDKCLTQFCCSELEQVMTKAEGPEILACRQACFDTLPIVRGGAGADKNEAARAPCLSACRDELPAGSDALGPARGCRDLECYRVCPRDDF